MKKLIFIVITAGFLTACASTPPVAIEPKGGLTPVNPVDINLSDLRVN